ncbi:MAG: C/D box methylation guide ribonucleoprotein complex aNOP56 subunit [Desulfurococcales archaeon]|nr:C/D box methylation guide ribonucleoprotein complex aNOP56 subunit [Desulfurococcales archaeon]
MGEAPDRVYVADTIFASVAVDGRGEVVAYELAPRSVDEAVEEALKLERGEANSQLQRLASKLREMGVSRVVVEDDEEARSLSRLGLDAEVEPAPEPVLRVREGMVDLAVRLGFAGSGEEFLRWLFEAELEYTRRKLRGAAQKRDLLAAQAIRAIDDIDKTVNLFVARLREWYSIHFPELNDLVKDHEMYAKIVAELGRRDEITAERLVKLGFSEERARQIEKAARESIGADLSDFDIEAVQTLAGIITDLYALRRRLADYIEAVMKEVAPNITALVGPLLGARLISLAGGLERLARLPASTIQVLGAEKALFRALRTGGKPPKHGVIFQFPYIHRSPKWQRGKIARALAAKLAIAAKVDAFTGRYIGDKLREELMRRIEEIKRIYAKPPKRRREERPAQPPRRPPRHRGRPRPRGRGRGGRGRGGRR